MMEKVYLTAEGLARLKEELEQLKGTARVELAKRLRAAIEEGDLSENADYQKAKEDQGFLEGRIQELEYVLSNATIIDNSHKERDVVEIGARITVQEDGFEPVTYSLVGAKEADPGNGRISNESPIGRAILGHKAGDVVTVDTPGGTVTLKIVEIE